MPLCRQGCCTADLRLTSNTSSIAADALWSEMALSFTRALDVIARQPLLPPQLQPGSHGKPPALQGRVLQRFMLLASSRQSVEYTHGVG